VRPTNLSGHGTPAYRCRYLDRAFDVFQIQDVACENDAEAIEMARPSPSWAARHPGVLEAAVRYALDL
jgi:hypothetical protein